MSHHTRATWEAADDAAEMLGAAHRAGATRQALVAAGCACARVALVHAADARPRRAIEVAEAWVRGDATSEDVRAANLDNARSATGTLALFVRRAASYATYLAFVEAEAKGFDSYVRAPALDAATVCGVLAARVILGHSRPAPATTARDALYDVAAREALRHMAPLVRRHVSWTTLERALWG